jgi:uncharacterized protein YjaG (DUF416 family)
VVVVVVTSRALRYDEARLVQDLSRLSPEARAAFAATCAERMLPIYRWFHERTGRGDPAALEGALAHLWADLGGGESSGLEIERGVAEGLVPDEDDSWVDECAFAQHAAASVAYAIRSRLEGDGQEAGWAARQVYEAIDLWVTTRDNVDVNAVGVEDRIVEDPLIQAELARQKRDIEALVASLDPVAMRELARSEGATLFGLLM